MISNCTFLIGRLTADPDVRNTPNGLAVVRYCLAVDGRTKKNGEKHTNFIRCIALGKNAEFAARNLCKGIKIAVQGEIETDSYQNKDGITVYTTEVKVSEHYLLEKKTTSSERDTHTAFDDVTPDDDVPF